MTLYPISKLSNILFTNQLKKYLEKTGSKVKTYSLHPGVVRTAMADDLMNEFKWAKALIYGMFPFIWLTMKSPYYGILLIKLTNRGNDIYLCCKFSI
jgi:NAD(P)-dependent dehydrogenase (short-subunit alcohol dehydrogenase family)